MDATRTPSPASVARTWSRKPLEALRQSWPRFEPRLYALWAGALTLAVACVFYSSLRAQTLEVTLWRDPQQFDAVVRAGKLGPWSAPLDDVFIHFDFARATARGYPFQWSEGNGYSSGNTSLLYPFALALGYLAKFRGLDLMVWAGVVACVSVFGTLLSARRLFQGLPWWTAYGAPVALLGVGALSWSLFSGMEVALFLALWGLALVAWDTLWHRARERRANRAHALTLGLVGALVVATRPEAAALVALFGVSAAWAVFRASGVRGALWTLALAGAPGALVLVGHSIANHVLTGSSTAAGALVKLELHHPYMDRQAVWDAWLFHLRYQVLRVTHYHFTDVPWIGWVVWVFAACSVVFRSTRRFGVLLWLSALSWVLTVALNGQVRWQNERYTMPAVAWLLLAASLGFGALLTFAFSPALPRPKLRSLVAVPALGLLALFAVHQAPRFNEQVWFFGRASRNIYEQQVTAGRLAGELIEPRPQRVLVGDAGAIPYMADLPALDLIGLGAYAGLPFASASRLGGGAGVELIEYLPPSARPDLMAIYPSWWGAFPLWFGHRITEVPVRGNVICGGASKVIYRPDWTPIEHSNEPFAAREKERLVDSLDFADVLSEKAHGVRWAQAHAAFVDMKMLGDPRDKQRDLWDAGRIFAPDQQATFQLAGFTPGQATRLLVRVAPAQRASLLIDVGGERVGELVLEPSDQWQERELAVPPQLVKDRLELRVTGGSGGNVVYHLFAVQDGAPHAP